jgi:hypothetical protein
MTHHLERMMDRLCNEPTLLPIAFDIDSQALGDRVRFYTTNKKTRGRKRHIAGDMRPCLLIIFLTPADITEFGDAQLPLNGLIQRLL